MQIAPHTLSRTPVSLSSLFVRGKMNKRLWKGYCESYLSTMSLFPRLTLLKQSISKPDVASECQTNNKAYENQIVPFSFCVWLKRAKPSFSSCFCCCFFFEKSTMKSHLFGLGNPFDETASATWSKLYFWKCSFLTWLLWALNLTMHTYMAFGFSWLERKTK